MATKLTKPVVRETSLESNGVQGDVLLTFSEAGVAFHKGKRKLGVTPWSEIVKVIKAPDNCPAKFKDDPLGWLLELSQEKDDKPATTPTPTTAPPDANATNTDAST